MSASEAKAKAEERLRRKARQRYSRASYAITAEYRQQAWIGGHKACTKEVRKLFNKAYNAEELLILIRDWLEKQP